MKNILIIDGLIKDINIIKENTNSNTTIYEYYESHSQEFFEEMIKLDYSNIAYIGFMYHYTGDKYVPFKFFRNSDDETFFPPNFIDFLNLIKLQNNNIIIDLLTCNVNYEFIINEINQLTTSTNVTIRYSTDEKGDIGSGGDWIQESHNVNIKNIYFLDSISNWKHTLALTSFDIEQFLTTTEPIFDYVTEDGKDVFYLNRDVIWSPEDTQFIITDSNDYILLQANQVVDGNGYTISLPDSTVGFQQLFHTDGLGVTSIDNAPIIRNLNVKWTKDWKKYPLMISSYAGGIVKGQFMKIYKCSTDGHIGNHSGGIIGFQVASDSGYAIIENCFSECDFKGPGTGCGIIIGSNFCYNRGTGEVRNCYSTTKKLTIKYSGGIIGNHIVVGGYIAGPEKITIEKCFSLGSLRDATVLSLPSTKSESAGGITGKSLFYDSNQQSIMKDCFCMAGNINDEVVPDNLYNGLAGTDSDLLDIVNCYSFTSNLFGYGTQEDDIRLQNSFSKDHFYFVTNKPVRIDEGYTYVTVGPTQYVADSNGNATSKVIPLDTSTWGRNQIRFRFGVDTLPFNKELFTSEVGEPYDSYDYFENEVFNSSIPYNNFDSYLKSKVPNLWDTDIWEAIDDDYPRLKIFNDNKNSVWENNNHESYNYQFKFERREPGDFEYNKLFLESFTLKDGTIIPSNTEIKIFSDERQPNKWILQYIDSNAVDLSNINNSYIENKFTTIGDKVYFSSSGESFYVHGQKYYYNSIHSTQTQYGDKIYKISIDGYNLPGNGGFGFVAFEKYSNDFQNEYTIQFLTPTTLTDGTPISTDTELKIVKNELYPDQWIETYNNQNTFNLSSNIPNLEDYFTSIGDKLYFSNGGSSFTAFYTTYNFNEIDTKTITFNDNIYNINIDFYGGSGGGYIEYISPVINSSTIIPTFRNFNSFFTYTESSDPFDIILLFEPLNENDILISRFSTLRNEDNTNFDSNTNLEQTITDIDNEMGLYTFNSSLYRYEMGAYTFEIKNVNNKYYINFNSTLFTTKILDYSDDTIELTNNNNKNYLICNITDEYLTELENTTEDKNKYVILNSNITNDNINKHWVIHKSNPYNPGSGYVYYNDDELDIISDIPDFTINSNSQQIDNNHYYIKNNINDIINSDFFSGNSDNNIKIILKLPTVFAGINYSLIEEVSIFNFNDRKIGQMNISSSNNYFYYILDKSELPKYINNFSIFKFNFIIKKNTIDKPINFYSPYLVNELNKNTYQQLNNQTPNHTLKIRHNVFNNINITEDQIITLDFKNPSDSTDYNIVYQDIKNLYCNIFIQIKFTNSSEILYQFIDTIYIPDFYTSNYNLPINKLHKFIPIDNKLENSLEKNYTNINLITQLFNSQNNIFNTYYTKLNFKYNVDNKRNILYKKLEARFYNNTSNIGELKLDTTEYIIFFKKTTTNSSFNINNYYSTILQNNITKGFIPNNYSFKTNLTVRIGRRTISYYYYNYTLLISQNILDDVIAFEDAFEFNNTGFSFNNNYNLTSNTLINSINVNNFFVDDFNISSGTSFETEVLKYTDPGSDTYNALQEIGWFTPGKDLTFSQKSQNDIKNIVEFTEGATSVDSNNQISEDSIINNTNPTTNSTNLIGSQNTMALSFTDINGTTVILNITKDGDNYVTSTFIYKNNKFGTGSLLMNVSVGYTIDNILIDNYTISIPINNNYEFSQDALRLYSINPFEIIFIDGDNNETDLTDIITRDDADIYYQLLIYDEAEIFLYLDHNKKYTVKIIQSDKDDILFNLTLTNNKEYTVNEGYTSDLVTFKNTLKINLFLYRLYLLNFTLPDTMQYLFDNYTVKYYDDIDLKTNITDCIFVTNENHIYYYGNHISLKNLFNKTITYNIRGKITTITGLAYGGSGIGMITITDLIPCFTGDTQILTPMGYRYIKDFEEGDLVKTDKGDIVPVNKVMIRYSKSSNDKPYLIPKNFYGSLPTDDIYISPLHVYKINDKWTRAKYEKNLQQVSLTDTITYYNLKLPDHNKHNLVCSGIVCESWNDYSDNKYTIWVKDKKQNMKKITL